MAYSAITLPLTGSGDATAAPACDVVDSKAYQAMKLMDGTEGSTIPVPAKGTTPGSTDHGLVVRPIGSTGFNQAVVGAVGLTSGSSEVALTSAGSTRLVGQVTVANPTTEVTISNPTTSVTITNPSTAVNVANQPTVDLSSVGSTRLAGRFTVENPTTAVNVANPTTAVTVSSGVVLGAGSSANTLGAVALVAGSTANTLGAVAQSSPAASSDSAWWVRTVSTQTGSGGSTAVDANLTSDGSTKIVGIAVDIPFSSAQYSRSSIASSADIAFLAANAARRSAIIQNSATATELLVSFSTAAVSSASAYTLKIPANGYLTIGGMNGSVPLYTGPIRGKLNSTAVSAVAYVSEFVGT